MRRALLIAAIIILSYFSLRLSPQKQVEVSKEATTSATLIAPDEAISRVTRVVDGDTILLENGTRVRYIGIDAPEASGACFAKEATDENRKLVEGKSVRLVKDISETDKYARELRYVYAGDVFVNEVLVRQGFAKTEPIKPDTLFAQRLYAAQEEAKAKNRGMWAACNLIH